MLGWWVIYFSHQVAQEFQLLVPRRICGWVS